jgi:hypothetical protein
MKMAKFQEKKVPVKKTSQKNTKKVGKIGAYCLVIFLTFFSRPFFFVYLCFPLQLKLDC